VGEREPASRRVALEADQLDGGGPGADRRGDQRHRGCAPRRADVPDHEAARGIAAGRRAPASMPASSARLLDVDPRGLDVRIADQGMISPDGTWRRPTDPSGASCSAKLPRLRGLRGLTRGRARRMIGIAAIEQSRAARGSTPETCRRGSASGSRHQREVECEVVIRDELQPSGSLH